MRNITTEIINSSENYRKSHPFLTQELYIPATTPKFSVKWGKNFNVFCIGSCFAREIELELQQKNCNVQTLVTLASFENNGLMSLMNEYNAGSIAQRIKWAFDPIELSDESIYLKNDKYIDLLLNSEKSHDKEWVLERRKRIQQVYDQLGNTNLVIITLGLTEAWYDNQTGFWLNRIPPYEQDPTRYTLKILGVQDCLDLLQPELKKLTDRNIPIVLTVSPVPLQITFSGKDAIIANEESKSTLRVVAKELSESSDLIDYFPSYETIRIHGVNNYYDGGIHVKFDVVEKIVSHMIHLYQAS
jgi:hypothetical protein